MKLLLSLLISAFSSFYAFSDQISATVVFENQSEQTSISGVFYILETNQTFQIKSMEKFTIELPKKGKYHFEFFSEDVNAFTYYPVKITERKNTVTIKLENKATGSKDVAAANTLLIDISSYSEEQIEAGVNDGSINFIFHGLMSLSPEAVKTFKDEFGVGFRSENCVIDPISFKMAMNINKKLEMYLNSKFGESWKAKLPAQPFGLQ